MGLDLATASLIVFYGTLALVTTFAVWKGGAPERAGASLLVFMVLFRFAGRLFHPAEFATVDAFALADDIIGFAGFTWIAYHAKRYWPLCAAALQLLSLAGHFVRQAEMKVQPLVYALMKSGPTYLVFLTLAVGTLAYVLRNRRARRAMSCAGPTGPGSPTDFSARRSHD